MLDAERGKQRVLMRSNLMPTWSECLQNYNCRGLLLPCIRSGPRPGLNRVSLVVAPNFPGLDAVCVGCAGQMGQTHLTVLKGSAAGVLVPHSFWSPCLRGGTVSGRWSWCFSWLESTRGLSWLTGPDSCGAYKHIPIGHSLYQVWFPFV